MRLLVPLVQRWQWHPTPVLLPGKSQGRRSLVGHGVVHGVAKGQTGLSDFNFTLPFMHWRRNWQTHSRVLAWRIPKTGNPGGLPSMGSHTVGHDWSDLAAAVSLIIWAAVVDRQEMFRLDVRQLIPKRIRKALLCNEKTH